MPAVIPAIFFQMLALKLFLPLLCHAANHQTTHHVVDAFKALAAFPHAIAMADTDDSGDLNCMGAVRTKFSDKPPRIVYDSFIKGRNGKINGTVTVCDLDYSRNITYHIKPGPKIDTTEFTVNDDYDHVLEAHFLFSDYKSCIIMELPIYDKQVCVMWTRDKVADSVPAVCTKELQEKCKNAATSYDDKTCGPFGF